MSETMTAAKLRAMMEDVMRMAAQRPAFNGHIVPSLAMVDQVEDWSRVRSPARARRRRNKHKQRIFIRFVPKREAVLINGVMYAHPEMIRAIREATHD